MLILSTALFVDKTRRCRHACVDTVNITCWVDKHTWLIMTIEAAEGWLTNQLLVQASGLSQKKRKFRVRGFHPLMSFATMSWRQVTHAAMSTLYVSMSMLTRFQALRCMNAFVFRLFFGAWHSTNARKTTINFLYIRVYWLLVVKNSVALVLKSNLYSEEYHNEMPVRIANSRSSSHVFLLQAMKAIGSWLLGCRRPKFETTRQ